MSRRSLEERHCEGWIISEGSSEDLKNRAFAATPQTRARERERENLLAMTVGGRGEARWKLRTPSYFSAGFFPRLARRLSFRLLLGHTLDYSA